MDGDTTLVKLHEVIQLAMRWEGHHLWRFLYNYDFGDYRQHELRLEKIVGPDPRMRYPVCTGGKRGHVRRKTAEGHEPTRNCCTLPGARSGTTNAVKFWSSRQKLQPGDFQPAQDQHLAQGAHPLLGSLR